MSNYKDQDSLRMTQLVQDFHPVIRRRAITSIRTSYPGFLNQQIVSNILLMNDSQKLIVQQYNKIHNIIDLVDEHIRRRIQCYQNQVVSVVQKQIQQMREQTGKVVQQFNAMIQQKNKQIQIWSLNNELDYFKCQAKKLFQQNRQMKKQNKELKRKINEYQAQLQNKQIIMQKLLYKYQKQKFYKEKMKQKLNQEIDTIKKQASLKKINGKSQLQKKFNSSIRKKRNYSTYEQQNSLDSVEVKQLNKKNQIILKQINEQSIQNVSNDEKNSSIHQLEKSLQSNSILAIDYDEQCDSSSISFINNAKSINLSPQKIQTKNQSSQANIYLSEYSYKQLFDKKNNKNIKSLTKQFAVQTQFNHDNFFILSNKNYQYENQTNNSSPHKIKGQIDFAKHGFHVNDIKQYRSTNINYRPSKNYHQKQVLTTNNRQKLMTEPDFNKKKTNSIRQSCQKEKNVKNRRLQTNKSFNRKMVCKFENNKIIQKAYSKQGFNTPQSK